MGQPACALDPIISKMPFRGVMATPMEQLSAGYDLQFHTNVLGEWFCPIPISSTNEDGKARVVNTASSAHYVARADPLNFDTFIDGGARWKYTTEDMYCQSKFVRVIFSNLYELLGSCRVNYARPTSSFQTNSRDGTGIMVLSRHRSIQVCICLTHWIIH